MGRSDVHFWEGCQESVLDIHELLRSHEGWQASAPTEEEAHGRENYNDILSM